MKRGKEYRQIEWEDEYNAWFCSSDILLEDIMVNPAINSNGLGITVEDGTYKISKPDSIIHYNCIRLGNRN